MGTTRSDFEWFFAREHDSLVRTLTLAFGDRHAAEDAAQEGFSRALAQWAKVRNADRPATWVYVVAVRYEWRRRRRHARRRTLPVLAPARDGAAEVTNRVLADSLLDTLTARQRRAVVLRYDADLSLEQMADALGCSLGTVKATLHQAIERLRITAGKDPTDAHL